MANMNVVDITSKLILILAILLVLYVIFHLGGFFWGLLINVIIGFILILILNALFNLGIPFDWITVIIVAVLGLIGVVIVVLLKLLKVKI